MTKSGARVLVLEARARLGGRATAFPDRETGELVDNGQHVLLGCYTDTFAFLERSAPRSRPAAAGTRRHDDRSRRASLAAGLPDAAGAVPSARGCDGVGRARLARQAVRLAHDDTVRLARRQLAPGAHGHRRLPGETVDAWLVRNGQTARIREMLWDPLALAALNQPPEVAAAPLIRARVGRDVRRRSARRSHRAADQTAAQDVCGAGADVRRKPWREGDDGRHGTSRRSRDGIDGRRGGGERWSTGTVVSAVPWFALADLFEALSAAADEDSSRASAMASSPIITVNFWFDRPVLDVPFLGLPGRAMQWVFDKSALLGDGASHLSLVSSGASPLVDHTNDALDRSGARRSCSRRCLASDRQVCYAGPSSASRAPRSRSRRASRRGRRQDAGPGLFLAGDWLDTGLPATIESAVRSDTRLRTASGWHLYRSLIEIESISDQMTR